MRILTMLAALLLLTAEATAQSLPVAEGQSYTLAAPAQVRYGAGTAWVTLNRGAGTWGCNNNGISDPAPGVVKRCELVAAPTGDAPPPCYPNDATASRHDRVYTRADGTEINEAQFALALALDPKSVFASQIWYCGTAPRYVTGRGDEVLVYLQSYAKSFFTGSKADRDAMWRANVGVPCTPGVECVNMAPQITAVKAKLAATAPPPPPPVLVCRTTAQSATVRDRQVYRANSAGTGIGTAISGVRVREFTLCGARLGTTNYYSVAGQKDTQGRDIAAGYAIGTLVQ